MRREGRPADDACEAGPGTPPRRAPGSSRADPARARRAQPRSPRRVPRACAGSSPASVSKAWRAAAGAGARSIRSTRGHDVDLALGHVGELLVGRLLFLQGLLEDLGAVITPELLGPGDQGAIARDLIVLDGLRRGDHGRIENVLVVDVADDVIRLLQDAVDRRTIHRFHRLPFELEYLLEPLHVVLGLVQVRLEALFELGV